MERIFAAALITLLLAVTVATDDCPGAVAPLMKSQNIEDPSLSEYLEMSLCPLSTFVFKTSLNVASIAYAYAASHSTSAGSDRCCVRTGEQMRSRIASRRTTRISKRDGWTQRVDREARTFLYLTCSASALLGGPYSGSEAKRSGRVVSTIGLEFTSEMVVRDLRRIGLICAHQ